MAFRSVTNSISSKRDQIRRILQLPPPGLGSSSGDDQTKIGRISSSNTTTSSPPDSKITEMAHGELTTLIQVDHGDPSDGLGLLLDPAVKDLEEAVTAYLRRATETFDLSKNVEVCTILCLSILLNCF